MPVSDVMRVLENAGASMRCSELERLLKTLGFDVRDGKKQGHKIVTHAGLEDFYSFSYTCGHGKNPEVKRNYVRTALNTVKTHQDGLKKYLESDRQ